MARISGCPSAWKALALSTVLLTSLSAEDAAQQRGWQIFLAAREAAGAGPKGTPLRDYSFELDTTTVMNDQEISLHSKVLYLHPNLIRNEIDTETGSVVMIYDGKRAYQVLPDDIRYLPDDALRSFTADLARSHVLLAEPPDPSSVRFLERAENKGRPVDVIEIDDVGGAPLRLHVDTETRDVLKKTFLGETPSGPARVEEHYSDFKEVGGYRWYHYRRVIRNNKVAQQATTSKLRVNTGLRRGDIIH